MNSQRISFYKDKVCLNFLVGNLKNAIDAVETVDGHGLSGLLTKNYETVESCVADVKEYLKYLDNVSVGLGGGDPNQWKMAAEVAFLTNPGHVNQSFTGAMYTKGLFHGGDCEDTIMNCMMYPTGTPGMVQISTGPVSGRYLPAVIDVESAVNLMKDLELPSIKFFNIQGTKYLEDLRVLAEACAKFGVPILEPTGGITPENIGTVVKTCLDAGIERVIPHIYSSIVNKETKMTDLVLLKNAYENIKKVV